MSKNKHGDVPSFLDKDSSKKINSITRTASFISRSFPDPVELQQLKEIDSSFPERIIAMTEKQAEHRQKLEREQVLASIENDKDQLKLYKRGQMFSLVICLFGFIFGGVLIYLGRNISGTVFSAIGLLPILRAFLSRDLLKK